MKKLFIFISLLFLLNILAFSDQTATQPVKAIVTISGGTQLAYNLDQNAFGIDNFIRKFGFWLEFLNSSEAYPQYQANPEEDGVQLLFNFKDFKIALNLFSDQGIPSGYQDLNPGVQGYRISYEAQFDGIEAILFWKGFYVGILGSDYFTVPQFNIAETNAGNIRPRYNNEAALFKNPGLFQPNSDDWNVNPSKYATNPTYYTLSLDGANFAGGTLTGTKINVNPYAAAAFTSGTFWCGYTSPLFAVDLKVGSQKPGFDLLSNPANVNTANAFNFMANLLLKPFENFYFIATGITGINYAQADTTHGAGALVSYAISLSEDIYLVPVIGFDWMSKLTNSYEGVVGLKFLWSGIKTSGRNYFNGQPTLRGLSAVAIYNDDNNLQLQFALFEPANNGSLIPYLGFQAFGEIKNLLSEPSIDSGQILWGVGGRIDYLFADIDLLAYVYGHYKVNSTASDAGQMVWRTGLRYDGIKSVSLELYYVAASLNTSQINLGNIAFQLTFNY